MKKHITALVLLTAVMILVGACKDKSRTGELRDFVEKTCEEGQAYTDEQWDKANATFGELLEKTTGYEDVTPEELDEIAHLQGRYAAAAFMFRRQKDIVELGRDGDVIGILVEAPDTIAGDKRQ